MIFKLVWQMKHLWCWVSKYSNFTMRLECFDILMSRQDDLMEYVARYFEFLLMLYFLYEAFASWLLKIAMSQSPLRYGVLDCISFYQVWKIGIHHIHPLHFLIAEHFRQSSSSSVCKLFYILIFFSETTVIYPFLFFFFDEFHDNRKSKMAAITRRWLT